jgi:hydroxymethylglutaryl-CoA lyase
MRLQSVQICEVGPRDGFQFEEKPIPTHLKLDVIAGLVAAGLPRIQVTSFVHPVKVPQMSDAEEIVAALPRNTSTIFSGLCLNVKGVQRAAAAGLSHVDISIATNETHGRDNAGMTIEQGAEQAILMLEEAERLGLKAQLGLQTVFGYKKSGDTPLDLIVDFSRLFSGMAIESLSLADSTGLAHPDMMKERLAAVQDVVGSVPIVLHLHDTRGLGLVNLVAAIEMGIDRFDTSMGGLGGCPFIPGATGNIPTEEVAYLCTGMGIQTGVDVAAVARESRKIAQFLGKSLSGKLYALV